MKKFGTNKRNPNPPWPNEQAVVMVPPGSSPEAIGMNGQRLYNMQDNDIEDNDRTFNGQNYQIMDDKQMPSDQIPQNRPGNIMPSVPDNMMPQNSCGNSYISGYLCGQTGKYVRMEFLFGEQTHVEKTGVLREVGRNYIVMQEMGTNNMIVSPLDKIKFINIYNVNSDNV